MAEAPAPHHALVLQFVAALLQRTLGCPTVEGAPARVARLPGRPHALDQPSGDPDARATAVRPL
jgi:hypothetical protein